MCILVRFINIAMMYTGCSMQTAYFVQLLLRGKLMKRLIAIAALGCSLYASQAYSAPVIVEYKAQVSSLYESDRGPERQVDTSNVIGFNISRGETFTGYFVYDTTTPLDIDGPGWPYNYWLPGGNYQQYYKFANSDSLISLTTGDLHLDTRGLGQTLYTKGGFNNDAVFGNSYATFYHPAPYPSDGYLPVPEAWSSFSLNTEIRIGYITNDFSKDGRLAAQITSFRVVSAVPEPSTYAMLTAGLGLLAYSRRKSRKSADVCIV